MSRSWPYLTAVAVVGVLAGAAIGGKPEAQDPFVLSPEQVPTTTLSASTTAPSFATTTTNGAPQTTTATTVGDATDTTGAATAGESAATTRVVIADATGTTTALATAQAALTTAGYTQIATSAVAVVEASTTVYYRSGFAAQADAVAQLLGADQATLVPLLDQVLTPIDDQGDVVVLFGSDVAS